MKHNFKDKFEIKIRFSLKTRTLSTYPITDK